MTKTNIMSDAANLLEHISSSIVYDIHSHSECSVYCIFCFMFVVMVFSVFLHWFSLLTIYTSNQINSFHISVILYFICMFQTKRHHIQFTFHNNYYKIFVCVFSFIHEIEPLLKSIFMYLKNTNIKVYLIYTDIIPLVLI
jgi:hypothetical protein